MDEYARNRQLKQLKLLFSHSAAQAVSEWLRACERRSPVVFVGAGFSQNAVPRPGTNPSPIPLWHDFADLFRRALNEPEGEAASAYSIPHLADLYEIRYGRERLVSELLDLFQDDQYAPGPAHNALFGFPFEAVVTTNHLDTLLDGQPGWIPVIYDENLVGATRHQKEVVYIHGHRNHPPTWVVTRSQYEDLPRAKPGLMARVRQLLLQHPLLIVGYSLSDPDFHWLYRTVHSTLKGNNPMAVAIIHGSVEPAEAMHWQSLGVHLISFSQEVHERGYARNLVHFLSVPLKQPRPDAENVIADIRRASSFAERLAIFREAADSPRPVDAELRAIFDEASCWLEVACATVGGATVAEIQRFVSSRHLPKSLVTFPVREELADVPWRLSETARKDWFLFLLNWLLVKCTVGTNLLLDWLLDGLSIADETTFGTIVDAPDIVGAMVELLELTLREGMLSSESESFGRVIVRAVNWCRKTRDVERDERLRRLAAELRINVGAETAEGPTDSPDEGSRLPETSAEAQYLAAMKAGFDAAMGGEIADSFDAYERAAELGREAGQHLWEWNALRSATSLAIGHVDKTGDDRTRRQDAIRSRLGELRTDEDVRSEVAAERYLVGEVFRDLAQHYRHQLALERTGAEGLRFSNVPHRLWRRWRDLQMRHVAPGVQKSLLEPLTYAESRDVHGPFRLRLGYLFDDVVDFLEEQVESREPSGAEARGDRDRKLVDEVLRAKTHRTGMISRLRCVPELVWIMRPEDLDSAWEFVQKCHSKIGLHYRHFSGEGRLYREYPRAWRALVTFAPFDQAPRLLEEAVGTIESQLRSVDVGPMLTELPLRKWMGGPLRGVKSILRTLLAVSEKVADRNDPFSSFEDCTRAICDYLEEAPDVARPSAEERTRIHKLLARHGIGWSHFDGYGWTVRRRIAKATMTQAKYRDFRKTAIAEMRLLLTRAKGEEGVDKFKYRSTLVALTEGVGLMLGDDGPEQDVVDAALEAIKLLLTEHPSWIEFVRANPRYAYGPLILAVEERRMQLAGGITRRKCAELIIELLTINPTLLREMTRTLDPGQWPARFAWDEFLARTASGQLTTTKLEGAMAVCQAFQATTEGSAGRLHRSLLGCAHFLFSWITDENARLVAAATGALCSTLAAGWSVGDPPRAAAALRLAAGDPRTYVRHHVAGGIAEIAEAQGAGPAGTALNDTYEELKGDPYLAVRWAIASGHEKARRKKGRQAR